MNSLKTTILLFSAICLASLFSVSKSQNLPEDMTKDMYCTACLAMVDVLDNKMTQKTFDSQETKFFASLDEMCDQENFRKYDYIPPKMVKACQQILANNDDEELETEILQYYKTGKAVPSKKEVEFFVCTKWSLACLGVDRDKPEGLPVPEEEMYGETIKRMQAENKGNTKTASPVREVRKATEEDVEALKRESEQDKFEKEEEKLREAAEKAKAEKEQAEEPINKKAPKLEL